MPGTTAGLLLGILLLTGAAMGDDTPPPPIQPSDFRDWFEQAAAGRLDIPKAVKNRASDHRYVFVAGLGHERMPAYFAQNVKELRALGVPRGAIHVIEPSSRRTVEENREAVREEFLRIASEEGCGPLVVIAHSRGACDALAFALSEPEFVRDRVAAMFLVQGPFGGTGLADYVLGEGPSMDGRMPPGHRVLAHVLGRREKKLVRKGRHAGLADLTRDAAREYWKQALDDHADAVPVISPKVYFVEAETDPEDLRLFQRSMARYLDTYDDDANDGLVALADQSLPGIGTRLGTIDAGHNDLTRRFPATRDGRRSRRALIEAIVMAIGRAPTEAEPVHIIE